MLAYIPFIYFTLLLIIHLANPKKRFGAGAMSLLWIDISAFFSILLEERNLYGDWGCNENALSLGGVVLYCLLWTIVILPILKFDNKDLTINPTQKSDLFTYLCYFCIICVVIYVLTLGRIDYVLEKLQQSRVEAYEQNISADVTYTSQNRVLLWIPKIISYSSPLLMLCWFIANTIHIQRKVVNIGLLLSSLYLLITGYANGGRAQLIWWIITFCILYCFFAPYFSHKKRMWIFIVFACVSFGALISVMAITVSRFDSSVQYYVYDSIVGYAGQTLNNFCAQLPYADSIHLYKDRIMPLINFLQTHQPYNMSEYYDFLSTVYPIQVNVFFSVFGGLLMDSGIIGLCIYTCFYIAITILASPTNNQLDFYKLFLLAIIVCVPVRGVFGYPFTTTNGTLYLILVVALYCLFKYEIKYGKKHII